LEAAICEIEAVTGTDYNQILLAIADRYANYLISVADIVSPHKQRYKVASYEGLLGLAISSGRSLNVANVQQEGRYLAAVRETKSELVTPIRNAYSIIGVINSESEEIAGYDATICQKIEALSGALGELLPIYGWSPIDPPELPLIELLPRELRSKQ
jgi:signal transduction protein with GAF and PtsI domain